MNGYEALANAIYERAAMDYIKAIIDNDKHDARECEKFMLSGSYGIDPDYGKRIIRKINEEIEFAENVIQSFLSSGEESRCVDDTMVFVMHRLIKFRYNKQIKQFKKGTSRYIRRR